MRLLVLLTSLAAAADALAPPAARVVVVAGATGRTGRLVVDRLRREPATRVRALVRNATKAATLPDDVDVVVADLEDAAAVAAACAGAAGAVWCATGFATRKPTDAWNPLRTSAPRLVDEIALPAMANALGPAGRVVMVSSAGVTRPKWSPSRAKRHRGAHDIPIVRLNPGGVLGRKRKAEKRLIRATPNYCVVRPCGLNDDWAPGRVLVAQGDVAVGRTNPSDLADVVAQCLDLDEARGAVFECLTLGGYAPRASLAPALAALGAAEKSPRAVDATYALLQQLLPGVEQDATRLEMGARYDDVDAGDVGRAPGAAPTDRERATAAAAAASLAN